MNSSTFFGADNLGHLYLPVSSVCIDTVLCIDPKPSAQSKLWAILSSIPSLPPTKVLAASAHEALHFFEQILADDHKGLFVVCTQRLPDQLGHQLLQRFFEQRPDVYNVLVLDALNHDQVAAFQGVNYLYRCLEDAQLDTTLAFTVDTIVRQAQLQQQLQVTQTTLQGLELKLLDAEKAHQHTCHQAQAARLRLAHLLQHLEPVVWSMSLDCTLQDLSAATPSLYGRSVQSFFDYPTLWLEVVHPEDQDVVNHARQTLLETGVMALEYRIVCPNGETRWLRDQGYVVKTAQGQPIRMDGIVTDITRQERAKAQHQYDVLHDDLTGLPNRSYLTTKLNQAITHGQKHPHQKFAVLLMDLDRFNVINDGLGYHVGDQVLVAIANQLQEFVRQTDCVARLEGDEFTILLDRVQDTEEVTQIAERILSSLSSQFDVAGQAIFLSASMGIVLNSEDYHDGGSMLRDAAIAMNRAKALGKARHILFNPKMHTQTIQRMQLESDLRLACNREEFVLHYQPIVALKTGLLTGFEALIRWSHLNHGMIAPTEFIPIAEETGLIVKLGKWVLQMACEHLQQLHQEFPQAQDLRMSVNLASLQLQDSQLLDHLDRLLNKTGLKGATLKLELTESMLMQHQTQLIKTLNQICDRGIELSLDDFGTGYSSLSYLNRFPIHTLKIDRSFITHMRTNHQDLEIVRTIITLAHTLGMDVIAEGIETEQQATLLQKLGCEYGQGYFFSPPLDFDSIQHRLRTSQHLPLFSI